MASEMYEAVTRWLPCSIQAFATCGWKATGKRLPTVENGMTPAGRQNRPDNNVWLMLLNNPADAILA